MIYLENILATAAFTLSSFGMNVDFPFTSNVTAFWCILGAMGALMAVLLIYFEKISKR